MPKQKVHPENWRCPNPKCGKVHSKPHWKDYHQDTPGWLDKLKPHGSWDKASDPTYKIVCEVCGDRVVEKEIPVKGTENLLKCPKCETEYTNGETKYCKKDGRKLEKIKGEMITFCESCKEKREGVEAPLFCPHCGWGEERVVVMIT